MTPQEMLIGSGIASVLAAVVGGGLSGFGVVIPLLSDWRRQLGLFAIGICLIAFGLYSGEKPELAPVADGANVADFRPALTGELLPDFLLVTTNLSFRNPAENHKSIEWTDARLVLKIGPSSVPFRTYYLTKLDSNPDGDPKLWYGKEPKSFSPIIVKPGEVASGEVMFIPDDTGSGRYSWKSFYKETFDNQITRPKLLASIHWRKDGIDQKPFELACTAELTALAPDARKKFPSPEMAFPMTAECTR